MITWLKGIVRRTWERDEKMLKALNGEYTRNIHNSTLEIVKAFDGGLFLCPTKDLKSCNGADDAED